MSVVGKPLLMKFFFSLFVFILLETINVMKILKRVVTNVVCVTAAENYKKKKKKEN